MVVIREGNLTKQSGSALVRKWQVRWFVLEGAELRYYKQKDNATPAGVIKLGGCDVRQSTVDREHCLELEIPTRTYFFQAASDEDMNKWIAAIKTAIADAPLASTEPLEAEDDETPLNPAEEQDLLTKFAENMKIQGTVRELVSTLKKDPACAPEREKIVDPGSRVNKTGVMWKYHQTRHLWAKYKFVLKGTTLFRFTGEDTQEIKTIIRVNAVRVEDVADEEDALLLKQIAAESEAATKRLIIYTPKKTYKISPRTDFDLDEWVSAIEDAMRTDFTTEEMEAKTKAVAELQPMLTDQLRMETEHAAKLIDVLDSAGVGGGEEPIEKEGRLKIKRTLKQEWVAQTAMLSGNTLYFYNRDAQPAPTHPAYTVPLKYCTIIGDCEEIEAEVRDRVIKILTPVRVFYLKAKHGVAAEAWIAAIEKSMWGRRRQWFASREGGSASEQGAAATRQSTTKSMDGRQWQLRITQVGEEHKDKGTVFLLREGTNTAGRAGEQAVKLLDVKVSRDQAQLVVSGAEVTLIDSGSRRGTKVNGQRVAKHVLLEGDTVLMGETHLVLELVDKKKGLFS